MNEKIPINVIKMNDGELYMNPGHIKHLVDCRKGEIMEIININISLDEYDYLLEAIEEGVLQEALNFIYDTKERVSFIITKTL